MIFVEGVKVKYIDTKGLVHETPRLNKRFLINKDKIYKVDLVEKTLIIEVPGLGLEVFEVDDKIIEDILQQREVFEREQAEFYSRR